MRVGAEEGFCPAVGFGERSLDTFSGIDSVKMGIPGIASVEMGIPGIASAEMGIPEIGRAGTQRLTISNTERQIAAEEAQPITWLSSVAQGLARLMCFRISIRDWSNAEKSPSSSRV